MRNGTIFLVATMVFATMSHAFGLAQARAEGENFGGVFMGLRAIGSVAEMEETAFSNFAAGRVNNDTDLTASASGYIGYRFEDIPLRVDVEGGYRFRFDYDARDVNGGAITGYENNVDTTYALINLGWEIRYFDSIVPYLGASVGWARNSSNVDRDNLAGTVTSTENDVDNLALGVMAGIDWRFADDWGTGLGYRYINLGEVDTGPLAAGESFSTDDYVAHDVVLSLEYRF